MNSKKFNNFWLVFLNIKAKDGYIFNDLIDFDGVMDDTNYGGAWANIIIKSDDINGALALVPLGLDELNFDVVFIDKIENINSLLEYNEITEDVKNEVEWLSKSGYVFKISDKLFPYT